MKKATIRRVAKDCIALSIDLSQAHVNQVEATTLLEISDAKDLLFSLETELYPITQEDIDAEMGADEFKREKSL